MKIVADTHVHTVASTHAYSTVLENARFAADIGLKYLAITDHAPAVPDAPHLWHFFNMKMLPPEIFGVKILKGAEVNILDGDATLDLPTDTLDALDFVIASFHAPACTYTMDKKSCTSAYLKLAQNKNINVIGHSGGNAFEYDYEPTIKVFKEYNKLVEINENSFVVRQDSIKNCAEIARLCKKYQVNIIVNSDAHFAHSIGQVGNAMQLLSDIDFPANLIVNGTVERFEEYLALNNILQA